jgi:hypothetical protein
MSPYEDDDDEKDDILKMLSGEVDDYAGSQLKDPDSQGPDAGGVHVHINVTPHAQPDKKSGPEDEENGGGADKDGMKFKHGEDDTEGEHDMIAHVLGMHGGGCAY